MLVALQPLYATQTDYVSSPAGFVRLSIASNQSVLLALPFEPFSGLLGSVFTNQLTGASDESAADRILYWNSEQQQYAISYLNDKSWFVSGTSNEWSSQTLSVGKGFWIENRHGYQNVFLGGKVVLASTQDVALLPGLNLVSYPFFSKIQVNDSHLAAHGAWGATNLAEADRIQSAEGENFWLLDKPGHPADGMWLNETGGLAGLELFPYEGVWYTRVLTNSYAWSEGRPYSDIFGSTNSALKIVSLAPDASLENISLSIACSGGEGEQLDIFSKDLAASNSFVSGEGWTLAEESLATTGRTAITWTDSGSASRSSVTGIFSRIYLVGRTDIDSDSDQLSDAREVFMHQTSPTDSDTDDDGLNDSSELTAYGTNPKESDTDQDAMSDGSEVYWGFAPTNQNSFSILPWTETFEALNEGVIDGQAGWLASPLDIPVVQTNIVYLGQKALRLPQHSSRALIHHFYGTEGRTQVWVKMWIQPARSALPDPVEATNRATAIVAVDGYGRICGYDGLNEAWIAASNGPVSTGQWLRVIVALDYKNHTWKLYSDTTPLLSGLGFKDSTVREFSRAQWMGAFYSESYLDEVQITATEPTDLDDDADGLPNYWERQYGLSANNPDDALDDSDHDGLTNIEEFQGGTHPLDSDSDHDGIPDGMEQLWGLNPLTSNTYQTIPWSTGFEMSEGYQPGNLNTQNDWLVQTGTALVQTNACAAGQQAASLFSLQNEDPTIISHYCVGLTGMVVWTEMTIEMIGSPLPAIPNTAGMSAVVTLNGDRQLAGYDGLSCSWVVASNAMTGWPSVWAHLTVKRDYATKT
ncbi:MAG: hypothetical protein V2A34_12140, partial [Lentisphaerota bacterium]